MEQAALSRCGFFRMPRVAAHATVAPVHDPIAHEDALDGHMLAHAALGTLVIDTNTAPRKKVSHPSSYSRLLESAKPQLNTKHSNFAA